MKHLAEATALFLIVVCGFSQQQDSDRRGSRSQDEASVLMYRNGAGFFIDVPKGWVLDREVGKRFGTCCVYYPQGSTWDNAETVMYPNIATKGPSQNTLSEFMESDLASFRKHAPEMTYEDAQDIPLQNKRIAKIRIFRGVNRGSSEAVAYVDEEKIIALLVMSSKTTKGFNESMPLFRSAVQSYLYMNVTSDKDVKPGQGAPPKTPKDQ
jgi:hypothetical protein